MSDSTYSAVLDDGQDLETIELEFVDGSPQRDLVRTAVLDGTEVEVIWELDTDAVGYVYRPTAVDETGDSESPDAG